MLFISNDWWKENQTTTDSAHTSQLTFPQKVYKHSLKERAERKQKSPALLVEV